MHTIALFVDVSLGKASNTCTLWEAALYDKAWYCGSVVRREYRAPEAGFCGRRLQDIRNLIFPGFRDFRASVTQMSLNWRTPSLPNLALPSSHAHLSINQTCNTITWLFRYCRHSVLRLLDHFSVEH